MSARRLKMNMQIPEDLHRIHGMFSDAGEQLFVVGGAVRDTLLGKEPKDFDLVTGAKPDRVIQVLEKDPALRIDLTGKAFGVVRVKTPDGEEFEIATFRTDDTPGRRPDSVTFSTIEDDVKRRDLTINALFFDLGSREVVDFVGGLDDLQDGIIRTVGDPARRFAEDPLRVLRAVRFAARMGSSLDEETRRAILADKELVGVSVDRIHEEFVKGIKQAQDSLEFFELLDELGLFDRILPGLEVDGTRAAVATRHLPTNLALVILDKDLRKVEGVLRSMKFTKDEIEQTLFLLRFFEFARARDFTESASLKKEFNRLRFPAEVLVAAAEEGGGGDWSGFAGDFVRFAKSPPAASSRELMSQGVKGAQLGQALRDAENVAFEQMVSEGLLRTLVSEVLSRR